MCDKNNNAVTLRSRLKNGWDAGLSYITLVRALLLSLAILLLPLMLLWSQIVVTGLEWCAQREITGSHIQSD